MNSLRNSRTDCELPEAASTNAEGHLLLGVETELLKDALDASHTGFLIIDMLRPKRPIVYANRAIALRTGFAVEELLGIPSKQLTAAAANAEVAGAIRDAMVAGKELNIELHATRKDGGLYWAGVGLTPLRDRNGRVTHYTCVSADITEKRDAAQQQQELAQRLAAALNERDRVEIDLRLAQKLEAVGRLAAGVAHEVNTPIQYVGDSVQFLQDAFADLKKVLHLYRQEIEVRSGSASIDALKTRMREAEEACDLAFLEEEVPKALERTLDGIGRVTKIVRAMKEFSHPDGTKFESADINHAIESTLTICKNEYKYVATVETNLGELPPVVCNVCELNQVFLNLIVNSAHAIEAMQRSSSEGRITIATRCVDDHIELAFADNGCGIPQEHIAKVFDPFFTTKEVGKGTGQGLAIVRSIVDKHKGSVNVVSTLGVGTEFIIRLPIKGPPQTETSP